MLTKSDSFAGLSRAGVAVADTATDAQAKLLFYLARGFFGALTSAPALPNILWAFVHLSSWLVIVVMVLSAPARRGELQERPSPLLTPSSLTPHVLSLRLQCSCGGYFGGDGGCNRQEC
ncbi:hypothetical protein WMY93_031241 [Mugilogobius chulae]|uniref:Uncharacterized protein n=1 Tax=Mugilogobius chulae TaxID=88201 RepID=A0AAW0MMU9_9GOBI